MMSPELDRLRPFNGAMGLLHLVQGLVMLVLSSDFSLPVTTAFLNFDETSGSLQPVVKTAFNLPIGPVVASFLFLSALAHALIVSPLVWPRYVEWIGRGINPARWVEYSISSSVMMVVIAQLTGIYDVVSLILLFGVNACMIWFGWMMEVHNQRTERTEWLSFWFGSAAGILPWVAVTIYLIGSGGDGGGPPGFVYAIFASLFVFFNIFAINMALQYLKIGKWRDYLYGERAYIWLSLVAKSLLAWQVFAGTLRPL